MFCEPPMYGRDDAGHSSTIATHQPPETTSASVAAASCPNRFLSDTGAHTAYTTASGGRIRNAWSVLVRNAKPIATPAHTSHFVRPSSRPRTTR